jgi:hypothetical protein
MARKKMDVADIKEILVAWDAGENVSAITRPSQCPPLRQDTNEVILVWPSGTPVWECDAMRDVVTISQCP